LLREYGEAYILEKVKILKETSTYKQGKIKSPAYLVSLLKNDAKEPKSLEKVGDIIKRRQDEAVAKANKQNDLEAKRRQAYYKFFSKSVYDIFYSQPQQKQEEVLTLFSEFLEKSSGFAFQEFKKHGLDSAIVSNNFLNFFKKNYPGYVDAIAEEEEYFSRMDA